MPLVDELGLSKALNRDRRAIRLAEASGRITKRPDGLYDLDEATKDWLETTHHEKGHNNRTLKMPGEIPSPDIPLRGETRSTDYAKARAGTQIYEALLKKLRYEERAKNLTPTADVENARFTEFRILREACFNIPARVAGLLQGQSVERCQQILDDELTRIFNAFADGKLST